MITIDYKDKRPLYEQITEKMQGLIISGVLDADMKIPSVRSLAIELSINPNTIQRAYTELERQGFIYSIKGKGNFVAALNEVKDLKEKVVMEKINELIQTVKQMGITKEEFLEMIESGIKEEKL